MIFDKKHNEWSEFYICYFREIHVGQRRWWMGELRVWTSSIGWVVAEVEVCGRSQLPKTWSMFSLSLDISSTLFFQNWEWGWDWEDLSDHINPFNYCRTLNVLKTLSTSRLAWTWWRCWICDLPSRWRVRFCSPSCFFRSWPPPQRSRPPSSTRAHPSKPLPR